MPACVGMTKRNVLTASELTERLYVLLPNSSCWQPDISIHGLLVVLIILITPLHQFRIGGDRSIDLDARTVFQLGVEFGELAEDADLLVVEIDLGELLEQPGVLDGLAHRAFVRYLQLEPDLFEFIRVGDSHVHL
jgi:hypothetical protein